MLRHFSSVRHMSVLFTDARLGTRARPGPRSSTGLWLSVVVHATLAGVLTAVVPTRASETTSTPRPRSIAVFTLPSTNAVTSPPIRVEAPRLPAPPVQVPSRPVQAAVIPDMPKPVAVAPVAARPLAPSASPLPAVAPALERHVEATAPERPPQTGLFECTTGSRASQSAAAVTTGGFGNASAPTT